MGQTEVTQGAFQKKQKLVMLVDEPGSREALRRLIQTLTSSPALWDDLLQEALIHLWMIEARRPGQTRSWYIQSCKFHLLHYLASGRSIDSNKRRDGQIHQDLQAEDQYDLYDVIDPSASILSYVGAREILSLLSGHLLPHERDVLHCLADGLGPREIGRRLNISHTMVIKHRCKIASLLSRLEGHRLPARRHNGNGLTFRPRPAPFLNSRRLASVA